MQRSSENETPKEMNQTVETLYQPVLQQMSAINPVEYGKTRNYTNGAVTRLSPYISRGVISTKMVLENVLLRGYKLYEIKQFAKELAWRDYFQRVWQHKDINKDIKQPQADVQHQTVPLAVMQAATGIAGIDNAISELYETGYMHNHCRMYTASVVCNVAHSHWRNPAQWMYYHLLDGDWGSNACSWQWVAGSNSNKKYFASQENISRYTNTPMQDSFLNVGYEAFETLQLPDLLKDTQHFEMKTLLPPANELQIDTSLPTFIYNYYNLDPLWHRAEKGNRILLLEPNIFEHYPVSEKCLHFMLDISKNIEGLQAFAGSFQELQNAYHLPKVYYKEHPLNSHYNGVRESRDWISDEVNDYYPSFFAYWERLEKAVKKKYS